MKDAGHSATRSVLPIANPRADEQLIGSGPITIPRLLASQGRHLCYYDVTTRHSRVMGRADPQEAKHIHEAEQYLSVHLPCDGVLRTLKRRSPGKTDRRERPCSQCLCPGLQIPDRLTRPETALSIGTAPHITGRSRWRHGARLRHCDIEDGLRVSKRKSRMGKFPGCSAAR